MASFLNKGKVTNLKCTASEQFPETKVMVIYAVIAYLTSTTDQHPQIDSDLYTALNIFSSKMGSSQLKWECLHRKICCVHKRTAGYAVFSQPIEFKRKHQSKKS